MEPGADASADPWRPAQYERFRDERSQPFFDLLALVRPRPGLRVVDLGCGTGALTRHLHETLGAAETLGLDRSPAMLAASAGLAGGGLRFEAGDIRDFAAPGAYDLVFSNAALQWVGDHPRLLARLADALAPEGQIAIQVPANFDHPSHVAAHETAAEPPFREALASYQREVSVLAPEAYAMLLDRLGFRAQHVRLQVYAHHLGSRDEVVEWVKGSLLTDYERRLTPPLFAAFVERYRARLADVLPDERPFFYPFKRILLWAAR